MTTPSFNMPNAPRRVGALISTTGAIFSSSSLLRIQDGYSLELSLTTEKWKYRRAADRREEIYDLVADPFELKDVSAQNPQVLADLRTQLTRIYAHQRTRGEALGGGALRDFSAEEIEQLKALGYGVD